MIGEELRPEARRLRDKGTSYAQIAAKLGLRDHTAAWRLLNTERRAAQVSRANVKRASAKRAWENANDRGTCACGATMGVGTARTGGRSCGDCRLDMVKLGRAMRRERIYELWHAGATTSEIAAAGWGASREAVSVEITYMRRDGWDMPYRRAPKGKR